MIRSALFTLSLAILTTLSACSPPAAGPGEGLLSHFEGAQYRGKWVVINYWAQWCKPCIKEIPELNELARKDPGIVVLGVNFDGALGAELDQQVETLGIGFPLILEDPAAVLGTDRPHALPTTLILDPEGELVETLMGPQTLESLLAVIERGEGKG